MPDLIENPWQRQERPFDPQREIERIGQRLLLDLGPGSRLTRTDISRIPPFPERYGSTLTPPWLTARFRPVQNS